MEISNVDPDQIRRYLQGVQWPADKQTIVSAAKSNGASEDILEQMGHSLAVQTFSGSEEVSRYMRS